MKNATNHQFTSEVAKVLKLVIHSVYTNRDIFLRELISNASDACDKLRYSSLTKPELLEGEADFSIKVDFNEEEKTITITDNGIGMSRDELIENLGTIAKSGTEEFMAGINSSDVSQIGQFGIGFYSAFMVANKVVVISRKAGEGRAHVWESDGGGEFTIAEHTDVFSRGTRVKLFISEEANEYLDKFRLKYIVETYSDHIAFPIYLGDEQVSKGSALWTRPKNEITSEQYTEFYRATAHQPDEPYLTLHSKVEGKYTYTCLLYAPSMKPFDLFHPDRKRRVKLYVKRVFITDEGVDLIPAYLRFIRGVVDCEDLPLNVSRETLQANPIVAQIREALAKKLLGEFSKKAKEDESEYLKFWANFGAAIKEGLCEALSPHEQILDICRFSSSESASPISLESYVASMKAEQENIFYLTGDNIEALKSDPRLDGFRQRGLEVLLFSDHVDDFWVTVCRKYKEKEFKSITRSDIELDKFKSKTEAKEEEKADAEKVISLFKEILGERVSDVRVTTKLYDVPACLSVQEGAMDARLERFLIEQKQLPSGSTKILELNASHPIIRKIENGGNSDLIELVFNQARILEGEQPENAGEFVRAMNRLLTV